MGIFRLNMALNPLSSANNGLNDLGLRSGLSQMAGKLNNAAEKINANGLGVEKSSNKFQKVPSNRDNK